MSAMLRVESMITNRYGASSARRRYSVRVRVKNASDSLSKRSGARAALRRSLAVSGGTSNSTAVTMDKAHSLAQQWLDRNEPGVKVETGGDAFPGYYTRETLRRDKITGMISVNATTGAVWPHWWHGAFIAKSEG